MPTGMHAFWRNATAICALAVLASTAGPAAGSPGHRPVDGRRDLGTLGGSSSTATALNDHGVIVGAADTRSGASHAFVWSRRTGMRDLGTLGGRHSRAVAVNDRGTVAGTAQTANGADHAFIWTAREGMRDLGTLGGRGSVAVAINDHGQVVGDADTLKHGRRAFRWSSRRGIRDLARSSWQQPQAVDLNNRGEVLGRYKTSSFIPRAFVWSVRSQARDIGDLGGNYITEPFDINDRSQVVGLSWVAGGGAHHAFVWTSRAGMKDLGTGERNAVPCVFSRALAINDRAEIVGARVDNDGQNFCRGVFWNRTTRGTDLLFDPADLNDRGLVVGSSATSVGDPSDEPGVPAGHAFCWFRRDRRLTDLGPGSAVAVNERGKVIGSITTTGGHRHAAAWLCRK